MSDDSDWVFDGHGNLFDLSQAQEVETYGPPPILRWLSSSDLPQVLGLRCAFAGRNRIVYDLRCASEVFEDSGGLYVNVVDEAQWYRWLDVDDSRRPERIPRATCVGARHVWIEVSEEPPPPPPHPLEGESP
ncbi:hypothetical protein GCM10022204_00150 [Microlunatus aurantiacus]|uniref:Uncharacterized protein n=1 Tax=Microlunatus aurantiacus TaxID=446786 RepID=A0ABP7CH87_9ACTN